jgi:HTH-like domain
VGHRKIWAMVRHDGNAVSEATILRLLRDQGLILPAQYRRERRKLADAARPRLRPSRPGRTRSGSWTSASSRPPAAATRGRGPSHTRRLAVAGLLTAERVTRDGTDSITVPGSAHHRVADVT